ncbi:hypothetical protein RUW00_21995 [Bacillus sp. IS1]|uniref:hypothetical protein n=1 Tax=Bacillus TaxID=1386 RepID=UPI0028FB0351|nr:MULTISPECIES: hypothetical protein [unclassified Bacillus (in: firmicutes)]MDU0078196.1 hypothetical protein [Bacillus sp. IG2]MDU0103905.1 hypothetical protein [Bacillus sp. IS1]
MTAAEVAVILGIFLTSLHICEKLLTLEKMLIERKSPKKKNPRKASRNSKRKFG